MVLHFLFGMVYKGTLIQIYNTLQNFEISLKRSSAGELYMGWVFETVYNHLTHNI